MSRSLNKVQLNIILDEEDEHFLNEYHWYPQRSRYGAVYARGYKKGEDPSKRIYLHRLLVGDREGCVVDHINGNPLDNRRINLRLCSRQQNQFNRGSNKGYRGVVWDKLTSSWIARIQKNKKSHFLGRFKEQRAAVVAYNLAAKNLYGEFAREAVWQGH